MTQTPVLLSPYEKCRREKGSLEEVLNLNGNSVELFFFFFLFGIVKECSNTFENKKTLRIYRKLQFGVILVKIHELFANFEFNTILKKKTLKYIKFMCILVFNIPQEF